MKTKIFILAAIVLLLGLIGYKYLYSTPTSTITEHVGYVVTPQPTYTQEALKDQENIKKYGHLVEHDYTPAPSKNGIPRYSDFDMLSRIKYSLDSNIFKGKEDPEPQTTSSLTQAQLDKLVGDGLYWQEVNVNVKKGEAEQGYGEGTVLETLPTIGTTEFINNLPFVKNTGYSVKFADIRLNVENGEYSSFFSHFTEPLNLIVKDIQYDEEYAYGYLLYKGIPVISANKRSYTGALFVYNAKTQKGSISADYSVKATGVQHKVPALTVEKLNKRLAKNLFSLLLVNDGSQWSDITDPKAWDTITFTEAKNAYFTQSTGLIPTFVLCGTAVVNKKKIYDSNGKVVGIKVHQEHYICALTEAIDYGDN